MKKIVLYLVLTSLFVFGSASVANASIISDKSYRLEQKKAVSRDIKQVKELIKVHNTFANKHDLAALNALYAENYISSDGFDKKVYFKSIEETWKECDDLTYTTRIKDINIKGDYASVSVEETATGTISDVLESEPIAGEIHSVSTGIYYLEKKNGKWYISGENDLTDESSLLYGDARFMNIEIQAPDQVSAGENFTTSLKVSADENTFIIGSIDHDPVTFPSGSPASNLRALPQSQTLERIITANSDNLNEYVIASLAISKVRKGSDENDVRVYMAGLACVMKRVNVVPKNNFIKLEEEKVENVNM